MSDGEFPLGCVVAASIVLGLSALGLHPLGIALGVLFGGLFVLLLVAAV